MICFETGFYLNCAICKKTMDVSVSARGDNSFFVTPCKCQKKEEEKTYTHELEFFSHKDFFSWLCGSNITPHLLTKDIVIDELLNFTSNYIRIKYTAKGKAI